MTDLATNVLNYAENLDILRRYLPDAAIDVVQLHRLQGKPGYGVMDTVRTSWLTSQSVGSPNSSWKTLGPLPVHPR